MADIKKVLEKMKDEEYVNSITENLCSAYAEFNVTVNKAPEAYARERKGRSGFYNPKSSKMEAFRIDILKQLKTHERAILTRLIDNKIQCEIHLDVKYYIKIQKADSIKDTILKEKGLVRPTTRPDLDNYDKFLLDSLHTVFYNDDSVVTKINTEKLYSINPRTEINVKIYY